MLLAKPVTTVVQSGEAPPANGGAPASAEVDAEIRAFIRISSSWERIR
jgi:hypothetical protein